MGKNRNRMLEEIAKHPKVSKVTKGGNIVLEEDFLTEIYDSWKPGQGYKPIKRMLDETGLDKLGVDTRAKALTIVNRYNKYGRPTKRADKEVSVDVVQSLMDHPYVDSVFSNGNIFFTDECKEFLYAEWEKDPRPETIEKILDEAGLGKDVVGDKKARNLAHRFKKYGRPKKGVQHIDINMAAPEDGKHLTKEELVAEGVLAVYKNHGYTVSDRFEQECIRAYPEKMPDDLLRERGIYPVDVGKTRLVTLRRRLLVWHDPVFLEELRANPCVAKAEGGFIYLEPNFKASVYDKWEETHEVETAYQALVEAGFDMEKLGRSYACALVGDFITNGKPVQFDRDFSFTVRERHLSYAEEAPSPKETVDVFVMEPVELSAEDSLDDDAVFPEAEEKADEQSVPPAGPDGSEGSDKPHDLETGKPAGACEKDEEPPKPERSFHPYIIVIDGSERFSEAFLNEAKPLTLHFDTDAILDAFELSGRDWIKPWEVKSKLKDWKPTEETVDMGTLLAYRIRGSKATLMETGADEVFKEIKVAFPNLSTPQRKDICLWIQSLPAHPDKAFSKKAIFNKCGILKSSYYRYVYDRNYGIALQEREKEDERDIRIVFDYRGYKKGARMVYMMLPELVGRKIGLRRIRRIMKKYGMDCGIRKKNEDAPVFMKENKKPNILRRRFRLFKPNTVRVTDVTYLYLSNGKKAYGSALMDPVTGVLIAFNVSDKNDLELVLKTLRLSDKHPCKDGGIFHSDQGVLYHTDTFQKEVLDRGFDQSMSKRGNCWDNATQESFFGHFKDECDYSSCGSVKELEKTVAGYVDYYNNERRVWDKERMTPLEYEHYLLSMSEDEWNAYLEHEEQRYEDMKAEAARKAIESAKNLGVEGVRIESDPETDEDFEDHDGGDGDE